MIRRLLFLSLLLLFSHHLWGQTSLAGKVTDEESGEPISFGTVALYKNGVLITGTETDLDGNYSISNIDPGTYDVEASFTGYSAVRMTSVQVLAGKANRLDFQISSGILMDEIVVKEYKVPLIQQDNTTSGGVVTGEQIRNLPTRNISAIAATTAGVSTADEGGAINVRGSRSNATYYYIDGIRVNARLIPETEIEQLQVITGGVEAQYGDVTGGIISITTKGPSSQLSGNVEFETSNFLDAYNNSLVGFGLSGPLVKKSSGETILGFRLSGRLTDRLDDDPPASDIFRIKQDRLSELEANPLIPTGGNVFVAADFMTNDDVDRLKYNPNERSTSVDLIGKLDARLSPAVDLSLSGAFSDSENRFTPGGWQLYNTHNNPLAMGNTYRVNFRLRHRLGGMSSKSIIQNASYNLQASYEKSFSDSYDSRHKQDYFRYGHTGTFDIEWVPSFVQVFDPETLTSYLVNTDNREVLRNYIPGDANPVRANYNNALGINFGDGLNSRIGDYIITNAGGAGNVINRSQFFAPNGGISSAFTSSWGFYSNVGAVYNSVAKGDNDILTFSANASFDLLPGGSEKGRHSIQFGLMYEQRTVRSYSVAPLGLWTLARQQANNHIAGIPFGIEGLLDTVGTVDFPNFPATVLHRVVTEQEIRDYLIQTGELDPDTEDSFADNLFYRRIRELTGQGLNEYVNIDGLDPDLLTLDLFSAKELNDVGLIGYVGYDYLGNRFDGTFDDFFTFTDANGVRTFPVTPFQPIYSAAYIQDKFTFKDIIFRLGVRIDAFDANTRVLKDPYSLYDIMGAGDYHGQFGGERPGNIGDDFKVYLDDLGTSVLAYRDGENWFGSNGTPINNPANFFSGGLVFPKYADENAENIANYIKSREFNPSSSFKDYETQINVMPRLAFSFPISTEANFFAHYDILVQRPPSNNFASPRNFFYFTDTQGLQNNPNLKPEKTIDYEVGFQQKLSESSALKISAYYKELRNMIQQRIYFPVPIVIQYTTYDNIDFGTVKGFSFQYDLRRTNNLSLNANYTLQFADGTGSNANSQSGIVNRGNLRTLFPLDFDERHRFNVNLDFRYSSGSFYNGPRLFGKEILANTGINIQTVAVSGRPFTATETPLELGGTGTIGAINGARKPWNFTVNAKIDKTFRLANNYGLNIYLRVSNVLDQRNIVGVYSATGSAYDDGFLLSERGEQQIQTIEDSSRSLGAYLSSYSWALLNPNLFTLPRRMFVGASLIF
jgi:outer membrane receptor protein involved in Fe transport